jgi:hypothetical protein
MATITTERVLGAYARHGLRRTDGWFSSYFSPAETADGLLVYGAKPGCCPLGALLVDALGIEAVRRFCAPEADGVGSDDRDVVSLAAEQLGVGKPYLYGFMEGIDCASAQAPAPYSFVAHQRVTVHGAEADEFQRGFAEARAVRPAVLTLPWTD